MHFLQALAEMLIIGYFRDLSSTTAFSGCKASKSVNASEVEALLVESVESAGALGNNKVNIGL